MIPAWEQDGQDFGAFQSNGTRRLLTPFEIAIALGHPPTSLWPDDADIRTLLRLVGSSITTPHALFVLDPPARLFSVLSAAFAVHRHKLDDPVWKFVAAHAKSVSEYFESETVSLRLPDLTRLLVPWCPWWTWSYFTFSWKFSTGISDFANLVAWIPGETNYTELRGTWTSGDRIQPAMTLLLDFRPTSIPRATLPDDDMSDSELRSYLVRMSSSGAAAPAGISPCSPIPVSSSAVPCNLVSPSAISPTQPYDVSTKKVIFQRDRRGQVLLQGSCPRSVLFDIAEHLSVPCVHPFKLRLTLAQHLIEPSDEPIASLDSNETLVIDVWVQDEAAVPQLSQAPTQPYPTDLIGVQLLLVEITGALIEPVDLIVGKSTTAYKIIETLLKTSTLVDLSGPNLDDFQALLCRDQEFDITDDTSVIRPSETEVFTLAFALSGGKNVRDPQVRDTSGGAPWLPSSISPDDLLLQCNATLTERGIVVPAAQLRYLLANPDTQAEIKSLPSAKHAYSCLMGLAKGLSLNWIALKTSDGPASVSSGSAPSASVDRKCSFQEIWNQYF
jgi:hypothetical protein